MMWTMVPGSAIGMGAMNNEFKWNEYCYRYRSDMQTREWYVAHRAQKSVGVSVAYCTHNWNANTS